MKNTQDIVHKISLAEELRNEKCWMFSIFHVWSTKYRADHTWSADGKRKTRGVQKCGQKCGSFVRVKCPNELSNPIIDNLESSLRFGYVIQH